jgi:glycosyltransferase involved in cell wall biosynthesis
MKQAATDEDTLDVSVIVVCGTEGRLLHHNLNSVMRAIEHARGNAIRAELVLIADSVDADTKKYLDDTVPSLLSGVFHVVETAFDDIASARNKGIEIANGEFVTVIDGKDLMSTNWIVKARGLLAKSDRPTIAHPQYAFSFEAKDRLRKIISSDDALFIAQGMVEEDYFCPLMMTKKSLAVKYRYRANEDNSSFGLSDWLWNCDTLEAGITHIAVPQTLYADRWLETDSRFDRNDKHLLQQTEYLRRGDDFPVEISQSTNNETAHTTLKEKTLSRTRVIVDSLYRTSLTRWVRGSHPRVDSYITAMRNETLHLFRPSTSLQQTPLPEWLLNDIKLMHAVDRRIFLSKHLQSVIERYSFQPSSFTQAYWHLVHALSLNADTLFIVPYLKNGGAEREIIRLIEYSLKTDPKKKIEMIATEPGGSPWAAQIKDIVSFTEVNDHFYALSPEQQGKLIATLCVQLTPRKMQVMNSVSGYIAIEDYGRAIMKKTMMFITIFMIDKTDEGRYTHVFTERMQKSIDYVEKVFTDNQTVVTELCELMGVSKDKFSVHYQPVDTSRMSKSKKNIEERFKSPPLRVLWAGRLDRQKRPDILIAVAEEASRLGLAINFSVYGSPAFEDSSYLESLKNCEYVTYGGGFSDGLRSLQLQDFDVFLMTSEWEGMPNVLLEAIVEGLLVIAPNVGGVAELVENKKTGILVDQYDNITAYIDALKFVGNLENPQSIILEAQNLVMERHTQEKYEERIKKEKAYLA